jgi:glycolate oxidase FAD binding subunit
VCTLDDGAATELRARLAEVALTPGAATLRAATLPDALGALLHDVTRLAQECGEPACYAAHAASGVARVVVRDPASVARFVAALRPRLEAAGGSLLLERSMPEVKHAIAPLGGVFGDPGEGLALMRRLKDAFDPRHTLAPGRFVAGI